MEALKSSFISPTPFPTSFSNPTRNPKRKPKAPTLFFCSISPDPWTLSDGHANNINKPKPRSKHPKNPLSDDNARRIIKAKAKYLSELRRNQGSHAQTPKWIKRTPEQMVQYLEDDRHGHLYGKHVVAAIQRVRSLSGRPEGSYDMREEMASFVAKLTFKEMCTVLKEQKGWRQAREFFEWMKLQLSYRPSVVVYTILLRLYGQVGKIKLAEQAFLEMLESGCEPDEVACGTMLCAYARWGRHKAMLSFHSAVQERGILLSVSVYNFMLSSLQKKSLHENVTTLWKQMVDKAVTPNHFTYTVVISSFVKQGLAEEAFKIFNEMKNMGFVPEEVTYSMVISSNCKRGNQNEAIRLYDDMRRQGIVASNYTCASLLALHYKNGDYSRALSLFSEMERNKIAADEVIYGLLIRVYGKLGLYEDAQRTFDEIENLGLLSDDKTYIAMAEVHLNSGNCEKALITMEQMKQRINWFSRFALIVLLRCHIMKEDVTSAEVTYEALSKTGLPDNFSCNNMVSLYMRLGLVEKAKDFVTQMREDKIEFDEELLRTVLKLYCKEGMIRETEQLIEEIRTSGRFKDSEFVQLFLMAMQSRSSKTSSPQVSVRHLDQPSAMAFELMLSLYLADDNPSRIEEILILLLKTANGLSLASQLVGKFIREGDIWKAERLYKQMIELGHIPEHVASASMISCYVKQDMLTQAREVFDTVANSTANVEHLCNSMIDAFAKSRQPEAAYLFYKEASQDGHNFGPVAISMLVNALTNAGKYGEAERVIHSSFENNLELDTVAYNTFIKSMLERGKLHSATSIYERMLSSGVSPSIQTYSIMISVYGRGRNLNKAVEIFNTARKVGMTLDEKAYTNLICYCGKAGKVNEASLLFKKMQDEGIKPGQVSYNIMMNAYAAAGLYGEAEELFQTMQKEGFVPDSLTYLALVRAYTLGLKYSKAEEAINSMQKEGILPSCAHFDLLLTSFAKSGLVQEAEQVYEKITTVGLSPDLACHRTMLRCYLDYGYVEKGIALYECIRSHVEQDRFIMSAAVHLFKSAGMESRAEEVLNSMNSFKIPFLDKLEIGSKTKGGFTV